MILRDGILQDARWASVAVQVDSEVGSEAAQEVLRVEEHPGDFLDEVGVDIGVRQHLGVVRALAMRCELAAEPLKPPQERDVVLNRRVLLLAHPVGAENCVVAGQAAFRYSLMSPPQRAVLTTWRCPSGWSAASMATGGR